MEVIRDSRIALGVDPLGGAGVHYWEPIAERYGLNLQVVNKVVDPTFLFHDARLGWTNPHGPFFVVCHAISSISLKDKFDVAFACDTDHDRHGIVTRSAGLLPPQSLPFGRAIHYLFSNRRSGGKHAAVGKTVVSSSMIDRVTGRRWEESFIEVPVGFKYFVDGLPAGGILAFPVRRAPVLRSCGAMAH